MHYSTYLQVWGNELESNREAIIVIENYSKLDTSNLQQTVIPHSPHSESGDVLLFEGLLSYLLLQKLFKTFAINPLHYRSLESHNNNVLFILLIYIFFSSHEAPNTIISIH